jgi:cell fate (sporulation/competence/biofilm development) regulator YlbF (YheA/YmcA/DUF963 family)
MKKPAPKNTDAEIAARLEALMDEVPLEPREVEETLQQAGIDPKTATDRIMARARQVQERERTQRFARAEAERVAALERIKSKRADRPQRNRAEILARIFEIRAEHPQVVSAMYRDFQSAPEQDLQSLLDDLEDMISSGEA